MSSSSENTPSSRPRSPHRTANRPSSPPRHPLHERSKSQTNASPTIRIVDQSDSDVYSKSPYPTQPSQILRPANAFAGLAYPDQGSHVSDHYSTTNAAPLDGPSAAPQTLVPKPHHLRKPNRSSAASATSDDDTVISGSPSFTHSYSSPRFSQDTTPPLSPSLHPVDRLKGLEKVREEAPTSAPTVRAVQPSSSIPSSSVVPSSSSTATVQPLANQDSKASLASAATSSGSSTIHLYEPSSSASSANNVSLSPVRKAKRPLYPYPKSKKRNTVLDAFRSQKSSDSLSSNKSGGSSDRSRSASAPVRTTYGQLHSPTESEALLQHPVVQPAEASGSGPNPQKVPKQPSRMTDQLAGHKWSSQLSTIPSESDRQSHSHSQSLASTSNLSYGRRREPTIASISSDQDLDSPSAISISIPRPLFSPLPLREARDSDEHDDTLAELQSPPLRHQRSGFFNRFSMDSRPSTSRSRPGTASSSQSDFVSFVANTIPAWARVYYRKGERASLAAPESSTESSASDSRLNTMQTGPSMSPTEPNFPLSIYRPRNRPRHHSQNVTDSLVISEVPVEQDLYVVGPPAVQNHLREGFGTPRLYLDRRSTAHMSAWRAPSFNESLGSLFSRRNRQILLFGLGFIFPLAWILGAVLPLPATPELSKEATPSQMDVERVMARNLGPIDEIQWQKAKWWRNLNRIMSIVGVLLIGAIIALAIVAAKMMAKS